ncbi:hypothetical protein [Actinoplanes sp. NPDC020271]|uniref:hypothetical protein n=1 Tax=Actinoplanes sp. NPDC020271 TaxID=3363896 RepID=UPI00378E4C78
MMIVKKTYVLGTAVAAVAVAGAVVAMHAADAADTPDSAAVDVVDPAVAQHELLDDVLAIDAKRATGTDFGFTYLPKNQPVGLRRMTPATAGDTIVDGYRIGTGPAQVFVEFSAEPTDTCNGITADPGSGICLKQRTLPDEPKMRNVTVYVTQIGVSAADAKDPAAQALQTFWSSTDLVPAGQAAWFTDLVTEARNAPKKRMG